MSIDLKRIPKLPQRNDSTFEQLVDLCSVANRLGMYDAADTIMQMVQQRSRVLTSLEEKPYKNKYGLVTMRSFLENQRKYPF